MSDIIQEWIADCNILIELSLYLLCMTIYVYRKYNTSIWFVSEFLVKNIMHLKMFNSYYYLEHQPHELFFYLTCHFKGGSISDVIPLVTEIVTRGFYYGRPSFPSNLIPWWWWRPQWVGLECLWLLLFCQWWACLWWYFDAK